MEDYQALCRQLEAVECSMPAVGLVEETEERLVERIGLYQARNLMHTERYPCKMSWDCLSNQNISISILPAASKDQLDGASASAVPAPGGGQEAPPVGQLFGLGEPADPAGGALALVHH